jgi:hypothetical protein
MNSLICRDEPGDVWLDDVRLNKTYACCAPGPECKRKVAYLRLRRWRGNAVRSTAFALCGKHWGTRNKGQGCTG